MSLALAIMFTLLHVGSKIVLVVPNHENRVCLTWMYIQHMHRSFNILWTCHGLFLDQIAYDNAYSTFRNHVVLCVHHKMESVEIVLYYKTS